MSTVRPARLAALALTLLAAPAVASAQLTSSGEGKADLQVVATASGLGGGTLAAVRYDTAAGTRIQTAKGNYAGASARARTGQVRAAASSATKTDHAVAEAGMTTHLWFLNTTDHDIVQVLDGFFDGTLDYTGAEAHPSGRAAVEMSLGVRNQWGWWVSSAYDSFFVPRLRDGAQTWDDVDYSASYARQLVTSVTIPPGASDWYFAIFLHTEAYGQFDADFSHTGNLHVAPTAGLTWRGDGGVLAGQYTPTWAGGTGPLEATLAPEPATLALVAGGAGLLLGARRRRRAR